MKILIGPIEIAGYYWQLTQGFRENGVRCDFVTLDEHPFGYESDPPPTLIRLARALDRISRRRFLSRISSRLRFLCLLVWFLLALPRYDVIIYGFGRTFLPNFLDVRIARFFKRTIIVNLGHGSDVRPPYMNGASKYVWAADGAKLAEATQRKVELVENWEIYATHIIGAPYSTSQFASRPFIDWFALGVPTAPQTSTRDRSVNELRERPIRVLHAPSRSRDKGTSAIRKIVRAIEREGVPLEYKEIQNQPNSVVLEALNWADLVVDQMWSDTPLAGFACEAAQRGCAVVVGGYGLNDIHLYSAAALPPSVTASPEDLPATLSDLIKTPDLIVNSGCDLQAFVEAHWRRDVVAGRYAQVAESEDLSGFTIDPRSVAYVAGGGAPKETVGAAVRSIVMTAGRQALGLDHRPDLLDELKTMLGDF